VVEVLNKVHIPFTDEELSYLLAYSGEVPKRYNRCIYWTTFGVEDQVLKFGIHRRTQPWSNISYFNGMAEAENFIEKYFVRENGSFIERQTHLPIPLHPEMKAVLIELSSHDRSPVHRGKWRHTTYPQVGVTLRYNSLLECHFAMDSGREVAWFTAEASTLEGVYSNWEYFHYINQAEHKDSRSRRW